MCSSVAGITGVLNGLVNHQHFNQQNNKIKTSTFSIVKKSVNNGKRFNTRNKISNVASRIAPNTALIKQVKFTPIVPLFAHLKKFKAGN